MPQCRRDQTRFAHFLLAVVVVESVFVMIAMTWEHKAAEHFAEERRQKRWWKREVKQKTNESSFKGTANKDFLNERYFSLDERLPEDRRMKKTAEMRSSELSAFQEKKAEAHLKYDGLKVQGQHNDGSDVELSDSRKNSEDVPVIAFDIRSHDQKAAKGSVLLKVLTNQEDGFLNSKFREERRNLRGSML